MTGGRNLLGRFALFLIPSNFMVSCGNERGPLQIQAGPGAVLSISDGPVYDLGSEFVDGVKDKSLTLTNTGTSEATQVSGSFNLSANFSFKGGFFPGVGGTCGAVLEAKGNCSLVVSFAPKFVGTFDEIVRVNYWNGVATQTTAAPQLKGKGIWGTPGTLDTTFQGTGTKIVSLGPLEESAAAVLIQSDGKILTIGAGHNGTDLDMLVMRYASDGSVDESFAGTGRVRIPVGTGTDFARAAVLQYDGKLVVVGTSIANSVAQIAMVRLQSDGALDSTFGNAGIVVTPVGGIDAEAVAVDLQADRKIVVAGYSGSTGSKDMLLARYESSGALDSGFGTAGILLLDFGGFDDVATQVKVDSSRLWVVGSASNGVTSDFAVARVLSSSALDDAFNATGKLTIDIGSNTHDEARAMALQSDGRIVIGGSTNGGSDDDFAVVRLTGAGGVDSQFGNSGKTVIAFGTGTDRPRGVMTHQDKRIILVGESHGSPALLRLTSTGAVDTGFGSNGKVILPLTGALFGLALQANGKPLVVGTVSAGGDLDVLISRYWP